METDDGDRGGMLDGGGVYEIHLQSFREVADVYDVLALIVPDQIQRLQRAVDQS